MDCIQDVIQDVIQPILFGIGIDGGTDTVMYLLNDDGSPLLNDDGTELISR